MGSKELQERNVDQRGGTAGTTLLGNRAGFEDIRAFFKHLCAINQYLQLRILACNRWCSQLKNSLRYLVDSLVTLGTAFDDINALEVGIVVAEIEHGH
jgi:hypothetical protein